VIVGTGVVSALNGDGTISVLQRGGEVFAIPAAGLVVTVGAAVTLLRIGQTYRAIEVIATSVSGPELIANGGFAVADNPGGAALGISGWSTAWSSGPVAVSLDAIGGIGGTGAAMFTISPDTVPPIGSLSTDGAFYIDPAANYAFSLQVMCSSAVANLTVAASLITAPSIQACTPDLGTVLPLASITSPSTTYQALTNSLTTPGDCYYAAMWVKVTADAGTACQVRVDSISLHKTT